MLRTNNPNQKFTGLHFEDPWKDFLAGRKRREEATRDGTQLYNEVYNYRNDLFPVRSVPSESHPGYVSYNQEFFRIVTDDNEISKLLTQYFAKEHSYRSDSIGYGGAHDLAGFFEFALHGLLIDGVAYSAVEWGEIKLDSRAFILPRELSYVNPSTVKIVNSPTVYAVQEFSWIARKLNDYFEYQNNSFKKGELVVFKHPTLYPLSPVGIAIKYLKDLKTWISFSLWQGKANAEPTNHTLKVEKTRYQHSDDYRRKQEISRIKVKRLFEQPIGGEGPMTTYYEVYAYAEYKKFLNIMRNHLVSEFNKQILPWVQSKNEIKSPLILEYRGFTSNEVINKALEDFKQGKVDVKGFVEAIKDDYNKELY